MSTKKIGTKPAPAAGPRVKTRSEPEPMKRLTIDVPESLHRRIKTACAQRGTKIADEVRELLVKKYGTV